MYSLSFEMSENNKKGVIMKISVLISYTQNNAYLEKGKSTNRQWRVRKIK